MVVLKDNRSRNYTAPFSFLKEGDKRAKGKYAKWLEPENLILIEGWSRNGLTQEDIAHNMGIALTTLKDWCKKHAPISAAIKNGKVVADLRMENALYQRGLGGIREVKKTFKLKHTYYDAQGRKCEKEELATGIDEVYIPGDTAAQIYWLKNRKPEEWRDKRNVEQKVEFENDGFLEALKGNVGNTFEEAGGIVET